MTLPRGFKANAEREAVRLRNEMGLPPNAPISIHVLAEHLGIAVVSGEQLGALEALEELERMQAYAFSAATFHVKGKNYVVTNPLRTAGRLASDVAHEVAHLLLRHELTEIREVGGIPFRTCMPEQEEQATAMGGTLLLPRPLLMTAVSRGMNPSQIADAYGVTNEMARFRYNTTGVVKQLSRRG
ncbi:ImmA/IrrE family metallo-endopeptidase [Actinomadura terrae]|uniref:ImmA/IrrE family metallo-endopeptidase n=1 Tax=Actinomadura terrae TaxID=604353 RepID=UPI001FA7BD09|nr:ImmA/IrrE family metallo-endopeptidase [Actinomadura terrae]